ncbi:CDGSH iron-sulfur domain-containing protein [Nocardioides panacisoli]|uniref:Iron-binding zinc finger CDGSH type domain-containing protein n=1 Tax=Nocardioides panacisoli TaxID=627624 RepID=A0ABP7HW89_9ACTN
MTTVSVRQCPGGPLLVRGATQVETEDGELVPVARPVVALCQCGRSGRMPWCDSSHKFGSDGITRRRQD